MCRCYIEDTSVWHWVGPQLVCSKPILKIQWYIKKGQSLLEIWSTETLISGFQSSMTVIGMLVSSVTTIMVAQQSKKEREMACASKKCGESVKKWNGVKHSCAPIEQRGQQFLMARQALRGNCVQRNMQKGNKEPHHKKLDKGLWHSSGLKQYQCTMHITNTAGGDVVTNQIKTPCKGLLLPYLAGNLQKLQMLKVLL